MQRCLPLGTEPQGLQIKSFTDTPQNELKGLNLIRQTDRQTHTHTHTHTRNREPFPAAMQEKVFIFLKPCSLELSSKVL